jgi:beta/gamma crystallin
MRSTVTAAAKIFAVVALASFAVSAQAEQKKPPPPKPPPPPRVVNRPPPPVNRPVIQNRPITNTPNRTNTNTPNRTFTNTPNRTNPGPEFRRGPTGPGGPGGPGPIGTGPGRGPVTGGPLLRPGPGGLRPGPGGPGGVGALRTGPGRPLATPIGGRPNFPRVSVNNRFFRINKGPHFMYFGGIRRAFVPIGLLGVAFWGGSYWYPDGYVSVAAPYCSGVTPDGCQLYWRDVNFEDGGGAPQCVQYCPQSGPPPAQFVTLPPPPPPPPEPPPGACQVTIFADPNFAGVSAPTGDNQPDLSQTGWQNAIASLQVQSGTWDFFSDNDFGGESLRLGPGTYPMLPPEWVKKINSFMCTQPGPSA